MSGLGQWNLSDAPTVREGGKERQAARRAFRELELGNGTLKLELNPFLA